MQASKAGGHQYNDTSTIKVLEYSLILVSVIRFAIW